MDRWCSGSSVLSCLVVTIFVVAGIYVCGLWGWRQGWRRKKMRVVVHGSWGLQKGARRLVVVVWWSFFLSWWMGIVEGDWWWAPHVDVYGGKEWWREMVVKSGKMKKWCSPFFSQPLFSLKFFFSKLSFFFLFQNSTSLLYWSLLSFFFQNHESLLSPNS